jgi:hypothetical protein
MKNLLVQLKAKTVNYFVEYDGEVYKITMEKREAGLVKHYKYVNNSWVKFQDDAFTQLFNDHVLRIYSGVGKAIPID